MKKIFLLLLYLKCSGLQSQNSVGPQRYIFFLHNKFIEEVGLDARHPEYGRAEYKETVHAFEKENFKVISEVRPKNTVVKTYALKVVKQIDSLLKKGVPPSSITVIGISKGGYIAMFVSGLAKNPGLNFVFIGCCSDHDLEVPDLNFCGHILSIYEKNDTQSCLPLKERSSNQVKHFKEIELHTGLKHGFLYKPLKEWVNPSLQWARQEF